MDTRLPLKIVLFSMITMGVWISPGFTGSSQSSQMNPVQSIETLVQKIKMGIMAEEKLRAPSSTDKSLYTQYREDNMKIHGELSQYIDFERLGIKSMPKKWQDKYWKWGGKKKYLSLLQDLIEEIVYPRAREFFEDVNVKYQKPVISSDGRTASVKCRVAIKNKKGKYIDVQYRMVQKNNQWKIFDVQLEGEWWTDSFESQFNHIITTKSYDELIRLMQKKLKNVEEGTSF